MTRTGNASSSNFAVKLRIEAAGRLLLWPAAAIATGALIVLGMPIPAPLKAALLTAWLCHEGRQLYQFASGSRRFAMLSMSGDECLGLQGSHRAVPLDIHGATFLGSRFLWLHLDLPDGTRWYTMICRSRLSPHDWRRLHVLLRFRR